MIRIKYITLVKPSRNHINRDLSDILQQRLSDSDSMQVVDTSPELVHIVGTWTRGSVNAIKKIKAKKLPVIFTSIEGLSPLVDMNGDRTRSIAKMAVIRNICSKCDIIHVCGPIEDSVLKSVAKKARTTIIANSTFTSLTNETAMTDLFANTYESIYAANTSQINDGIKAKVKAATDNKTIADICTHLLYLRSRYIMGCIKQEFLDETSRLLVASDYDENEMARVLTTLGITKFSAYSMTLLEQKSQLTEGFMPIASAEGRIADRMLNMTVQ